MQDIQQIARDRLPVVRDPLLVVAAPNGGHELVAILLDDEPDELLGDVHVRLHDEERVERVRAGCVRVVEKVLDLRERRLPEARAAVLGRQLRLPVRLLQPERFGRVHERGHNAAVQRLHLLQARGCVLALRGRALVHPDAHEDLTQERKYARDVVEARDERRLPVGLGQVRARGDAGYWRLS